MKSMFSRGLFVVSLVCGTSVPAFAKGLNGVCEGTDGKAIKHIKTEQECTEKGGKLVPKKKKGDIAKKQEAVKSADVKEVNQEQPAAEKSVNTQTEQKH